MDDEPKLEDFFEKWNELNQKVGQSFGQFNFDEIKKHREQQRIIEDEIYKQLVQSAPEGIKKVLPEDCGELEIGYDTKDKKFYFLMYDPDQDPEEEPSRIDAITLNLKKEVGIIKDFEQEEDEE